MYVKVGTVTFPSGSGNFSVECGFTPSALMLFTAGSSTGFTGFWDMSIGWADENLLMLCGRTEAQTGTVTYTFQNTVGKLLDGFVNNCTVVSYDACGFTLHTDGGSPVDAFYMAIGGPNTRAVWSGYNVAAGSTADVANTQPGFVPDFLWCMQNDQVFQWAHSGFGFTEGPGLGAANSTMLNATEFTNRFEPGAMYAWNQFSGDLQRHELKSFDTNGYTVKVTQNNSSVQRGQWALAIKDPDATFYTGAETQKTSTGTKSTTGAGFRPGAGFFMSTLLTSSPQSGFALPVGASFGVTDGTDQRVVWVGGDPGTGDQAYGSDTALLANIDGTTFSVLGLGGLASFDADGFTIDWTTADSTARYFGFGLIETQTWPDPDCGVQGVVSLYVTFPE